VSIGVSTGVSIGVSTGVSIEADQMQRI